MGRFPRMARCLSGILPLLILLSGILPGFSTAARASLRSELNSRQQEELSSGKPVVLEEEVPGEPWPLMTIYQQVVCSPAELAGVFWNSELDPDYLPGCLSVKVLARPSPSVHEARFTLKMPFLLPDEVYTSRIELIPQPPGLPESYKIRWQILESRYSKSCRGEIVMEGSGGGTLFRYRNFMSPRSRIAVLMRAPAKDRLVQSVEAMVAQVARERKQSPELIERQRNALRLALGRKPSVGAEQSSAR